MVIQEQTHKQHVQDNILIIAQQTQPRNEVYRNHKHQQEE